jgi:DNA polymerase-4
MASTVVDHRPAATLPSGMTARIMHVDLDAFFVQVCRQHYPELRDVEPLIVGGRSRRGVVQSASYVARRAGVRSGMPVGEAAHLCPEAHLVQGEFRFYRDASRAVAKVLREFSPTIVMASLDEAYLDYRGTDRLHPISLLPEAERIRDRVREVTGLACSIGIGPNRMIAKLASDNAKPRGLMEVRAGWEMGFLAGLPLAALPGVGPVTAERWQSLGLVDVSQVQAMSETALEALIGKEAALLRRRAMGFGGTTLSADRLPRSVSRETTLARDERDAHRLDGLLVLLVTRVAAQLRDEQLMARTVTLKLRHDDFRTVTRRVTLPEPTNLDADLLGAARSLFPRAFQEVRARNRGVRLIGVGATGITPVASLDLFEPPERSRRRRLTEAVDRVRRKFGDAAVGTARLLEVKGRKQGGQDGRDY